MQASDYEDTWRMLSRERSELADQRATLEAELSEIHNKISHLDEVLSHLAPLTGSPMVPGSLDGLGITDAIRTVLREANEGMIATDIRKALREKGFNTEGFAAPMASIYKVLSRLVEANEVLRFKSEEGRLLFSWIRPEITDDDIPF